MASESAPGSAAHECFDLDGARVHGDPNMSVESRDALRDLIGAAERLLEQESEVGYINVQVGGSFVGQFGIKSTTEQFSAMDHGHADAVARAIEYLSGVVLPRATALDHKLQAEGAAPTSGFTPKRILTDG